MRLPRFSDKAIMIARLTHGKTQRRDHCGFREQTYVILRGLRHASTDLTHETI